LSKTRALFKAAAVGWGLIYFALGAVKSFTLNSNDTWESVVLLFGMFLLPLPIVVIAFWSPRAGGRALLGCVAANVVAMAAVIARHTYPSFSDVGRLVLFIALFDIPHLFFGMSFLMMGGERGKTGADGHFSSRRREW